MERSDFDRMLSEEIDTLLRVEPSCDFGARIRQRVEEHGSRSPRRMGLMWAPLAVAASVVIVVVLMEPRSPSVLPPSKVPYTAKEPTRDATIVAPEQLPDGSTRGPSARPTSAASTTPRQPPRRTDASEVIISADDVAGVDAWLSIVRSGHIWVEIVPDADAAWGTHIEPIRIDPLPSIAPLDEGPV